MVDTRKNLRVYQPQNLTVNTNFEVQWYQDVTCVNHIRRYLYLWPRRLLSRTSHLHIFL